MKNTAILMFSVFVLSGFLANAHGDDKRVGASAYNAKTDSRHWEAAPVPKFNGQFDRVYAHDGNYGGYPTAFAPRPCSDGLRRSAGICSGDQFPVWGSLFGISGSF